MKAKLAEHIEISEGSGVPRLAGHRLTVHFVMHLIYHEGLTPEKVAEQYNLSLGQVFAALSFYHDNKTLIDDLLAAEDRALEAVESLPEPEDGKVWEVLTVKEIAAIFEIDESTVREAAAREWVYGRKAGGTWLISREDAEKRWGSTKIDRNE